MEARGGHQYVLPGLLLRLFEMGVSHCTRMKFMVSACLAAYPTLGFTISLFQHRGYRHVLSPTFMVLTFGQPAFY